MGIDDVKQYVGAYWLPPKHDGVMVATKFRSANGLGAIILVEQLFLIDTSGKVFDVIDPDDFRRASQPSVPNSDPLMDSFQSQFQ